MSDFIINNRMISQYAKQKNNPKKARRLINALHVHIGRMEQEKACIGAQGNFLPTIKHALAIP